MRCVVWWILFLSVAGCGSTYDVGPFGRYLRNFKTQAHLHGREVTVSKLQVAFGDTPEGTQGFCTFSSVPQFDWAIEFAIVPVIHLRQGAWDEASEWEREALIFHEFGHCLLGRAHETRWNDEEDRPLSLMYPRKFNGEKYQKYRDYYVDELFHPAE